MDFLKNAKQAFSDAKQAVFDGAHRINQAVIDKLDSKTPVLSICMMGPRSVGKTTVLTSIFSESQAKLCEGSRLYMNALDQNTSKLNDYHTMLVDAVAKKDAANLPASNVVSKFLFGIGIAGRIPSVKLAVQDFPGEYLTSNMRDDRDEVYNFMSGATVILIAVDTPYLMEDGGRYNNDKNKIDIVTHYLKDNASAVKDKLVLFVPLKCERYMHDGRIEEVSQKTVEAYSELIAFFRSNNIASLVTPIITLGGMEFDRMVDTPAGTSDVAKIATYRPWEKLPQYRPLFCPQPLYYLLTYVSNYYEWYEQQKKGFLHDMWSSVYSFIKRDNDFRQEIKKLSRYILYNKNGFIPVTHNSILKLN